jgi:hypothetical protein
VFCAVPDVPRAVPEVSRAVPYVFRAVPEVFRAASVFPIGVPCFSNMPMSAYQSNNL